MSDFDEKLNELEKRRAERTQAFFKRMINKIPLFVGILIAIWWVFYGMVDVEFKFSLLLENILLTVATIVFAITYCNLIANSGFQTAEKTKEYINAKESYYEAQKKGYKYQKEINDYTKEIAIKNLADLRRENLEANLIKYEDVFDKDGRFIKKDYRKDKTLTRHQKKIIRRCAELHISETRIFEGIGSKFYGIKRDVTKTEFITKQTAVKTFTRTILAFTSAFVFFRFKGFSLDGVMYSLFQITMWTASGVSQRIKNYSFVIDNILPQIISKTLVIESFLENRQNITGGIQNG